MFQKLNDTHDMLQSQVTVSIEKGSGYFQLRSGREGVVSLDYNEQDKNVQVSFVLNSDNKLNYDDQKF